MVAVQVLFLFWRLDGGEIEVWATIPFLEFYTSNDGQLGSSDHFFREDVALIILNITSSWVVCIQAGFDLNAGVFVSGRPAIQYLGEVTRDERGH